MDPADAEIVGYYGRGTERGRLDSPVGELEFRRVREILGRWLPAPPARVADIGGGPGRHAHALAADGYAVTLLDPVPLHVRQAAGPGTPRVTALRADARQVPLAAGSVDCVLLFGPLYHLQRAADRRHVWREAWRVLRDGGVVAGIGISRYYLTWYVLAENQIGLPGVEALLDTHQATGRHHNPLPEPGALFTHAYLHRPEELAEEAAGAGFAVRALLAVEGPAVFLPDLAERLRDPVRRGQLLRAVRRLEAEPSVLGATQHALVVATKRAP